MEHAAIQAEIGVPMPARRSYVYRQAKDVLEFAGELVLLAGQVFRAIVTGRVAARDILNQMSAVGADSVGIVLVITAATGAVFAFYTATMANQIGGFTQFVGGTLGYGFLNELGPVLGGVAMAARVGAAIAAELGSMVVTEQVDALRAMAVSPVNYLVAPRVVACTVMLPLLIVLADVAGLIGGCLFAATSNVPYAQFWQSVHTYVKPNDLIRGLLKALFFGYTIGLVACRQGLKTRGGATGVGRATTGSVVLCVVLIFVSDFFLAQVLRSVRVGE